MVLGCLSWLFVQRITQIANRNITSSSKIPETTEESNSKRDAGEVIFQSAYPFKSILLFLAALVETMVTWKNESAVFIRAVFEVSNLISKNSVLDLRPILF